MRSIASFPQVFRRGLHLWDEMTLAFRIDHAHAACVLPAMMKVRKQQVDKLLQYAGVDIRSDSDLISDEKSIWRSKTGFCKPWRFDPFL